MNNEQISLAVARAIERVEADMMIDLTRVTPDNVRGPDYIRARRIGGAHAFLSEQIDWGLYNRVLGLGLEERATEAAVDAIKDLYRQTWMLFAVQLSPLAQPAMLPHWLEARQILREDDHPWVKFYRDVSPPPAVTTDFRIEQVSPGDQAFTWAATTNVACYLHGATTYWLSCTVDRPGWHQYLAYEGEDPVACGALYIQHGVGWLGFDGTFRSRRRRGAQRAIIARRISDAAALGCSLLTVETLEDRPERSNPSYRNMLWAGFKVAYVRPNYRFTGEIERTRPSY
jgi:hypothetical protein